MSHWKWSLTLAEYRGDHTNFRRYLSRRTKKYSLFYQDYIKHIQSLLDAKIRKFSKHAFIKKRRKSAPSSYSLIDWSRKIRWWKRKIKHALSTKIKRISNIRWKTKHSRMTILVKRASGRWTQDLIRMKVVGLGRIRVAEVRVEKVMHWQCY